MINKIEIEWRDDNYEYTETKHSSVYGEYDFHKMHVIESMLIKTSKKHCYKFDLIYQTGVSFANQDYNTPSNKLELDCDAGSSDLMSEISNYYEDDLNSEVLEYIKENYSDAAFIKTVDDLRKIYIALQENKHDIDDYLPETLTYFNDEV